MTHLSHTMTPQQHTAIFPFLQKGWKVAHIDHEGYVIIVDAGRISGAVNTSLPGPFSYSGSRTINKSTKVVHPSGEIIIETPSAWRAWGWGLVVFGVLTLLTLNPIGLLILPVGGLILLAAKKQTDDREFQRTKLGITRSM